MKALVSQKTDPLIGSVIGRNYRIVSRIGEGATGVVYEAQQLALGLRVAVKVMHRELQSQLSFVSRFHVEARAASAIAHENTTRILDYGVDPLRGFLYIAMEHLEGQTLEAMLRAGAPLSPGRVVDIVLQILGALGAAHKLGILHRDLRPRHVVVQQRVNDESRTRDFVKVCDFGIAPLADVGGVSALGGAEYLAPEQVLGGALDPRSDLYSAGAIFSQMLAGRLPFASGSGSRLRVNVDPELEAISRRATSPSPEDRYGSARQMRAALRATSIFRGLVARDWPAETSSAGVSIPAPFPRAEPEERRHGLHVATPFLAIPVADLATALSDRMETRRPPAMAPVPPSGAPSMPPALLRSVVPEGPPSEVQSRRAATAVSLRRSELATARQSRSKGLVVASFGLVTGVLAVGIGWRHLNTPAATMTEPVAPSAAPAPVAAAPLAPTASSMSPGPTAVVAPVATVAPAATVAPRKEASPATPPIAPRPVVFATAPVSAPSPSSTPSAPLLTSSIPASAPVAAPALAAVAPPSAPFHPDAAQVDVVKTESERVPAHSVNDTLRHANVQRCYVDALRRAGAAHEGTAVLTLSIDESRVTSASLRGLDLPGLSGCVAGQLANARVANADMGGATAAVTLRFSAP